MNNIISLDHNAVLSLLPDRDPWGHKGTFGKILLICGSKGYTGAPYFAAMGALRTGAGLVFLGVPESIYPIEAVKLNEPVVFSLHDEEGRIGEAAIPEIIEKAKHMDAVLIGCGLGQSSGTAAVVAAVLERVTRPVVLDADGINVLKNHMDILRGRSSVTVLTPHDGEFIRLAGPIGENRYDAAIRLAQNTGSIVLLKGHRTLITDGTVTYRNMTGNPGMAVGGSGDILAGMITALLGQGLRPLEAAACAAWLHGAAGDLCAKSMGQYGMLPSDMLEVLPRLLK